MKINKIVIITIVFVIFSLLGLSIGVWYFSSKNTQPLKFTEIATSTCNVEYDQTIESRVVLEKSPTLITGFEKKCDGYYYFTFDYLEPGQGNPESDSGSYYLNNDPKLRTFRMTKNLKVKLTDQTEIYLEAYVAILKKSDQTIFNQNNLYLRDAPDGQPVFFINIQNGLVVLMNEVYLP